MYNNHTHPNFSDSVLLLTCGCLRSSASRDLLEIRVSEIFKRSRALRDLRPNRILRWLVYNSCVCFVPTLDSKSGLHIAICPGQQAVCRYVWAEIPSHQLFSSSCWNLARVSLFFFPLLFRLSPALWLLSLRFPQYSSLDLRRLPQNTLHLGQKSQSSYKSFAFLLSYWAHSTDAPIRRRASLRRLQKGVIQSLFNTWWLFSRNCTNTEVVEGKLFPFNSPTGLINAPTFVEMLKRSHSRVYVLQMKQDFVSDFLQLYFYLHFYFNQKLSWSEWRPPTELVCVFKRLCLSPRVIVYQRRFILVQGLVIVLIGHAHQREELKGLMRTFHLAHRWLKVCPILSWVLLSPFLAFLFWNMIIVVFEFSGDFCSILHAVKGFF